MEKLLASFMSLFITMDAIGAIPFFLSLTENFSRKIRKEVILMSLVTVILVTLFFIYLGNIIFSWLKVSFADFLIASGLVLLIFSILEFLSVPRVRTHKADEIAVVPLGVPLLAGPAFLTTSLISRTLYGDINTLVSIFINVIIAGIVFFLSEKIIKFLGKPGLTGFSKIVSLFLASLGVNFIIMGITQIIKIL
jgi:multiple antibiotic resistance protein